MKQLRVPIGFSGALARCALGGCLCLAAGYGGQVSAEDSISFRQQIAPILLENCVACHGLKKAEGGYRLDTFEEMLKAGDSGETPVEASEVGASELVRRVMAQDASERMPAESSALTTEQIAAIEKWIAAGAEFDGEDRHLQLAFVIPPVTYAPPPETYAVPVPVTAAKFLADRQHVLVGGYHEVTVWDIATRKLLRRIPNVSERVYALSLDSERKTLAVAGGEPGRSGEVRLLDLETGELKGVIARAMDVVLDVAFSPNGKLLAVGSSDNSVHVFDASTLGEVHTLASHADWVTAVAWSADGSRLVSASRDKSVKVYEAESGKLLASYLGHNAAVRSVACLPDNKQAVSVGADGKLHRWTMEDAKKIAEVPLGSEAETLICTGDSVYVGCHDGRLRIVDLATNKVTKELQGHASWVLAAAVEEASDRIVSGALDGEMRVWSVKDGESLGAWSAKP